MGSGKVLAIDLGQSGTSMRLGDLSIESPRGKRAGENSLDALRAAFESLDHPEKISADCVTLSCTGFYGQVPDPENYLELCSKFFDATKVAVIDDGFASYIGALGGQDGVVLTIGGGVVSIGGLKGRYAHRDGLGSTFGDDGGGFWLGRNAISKALASQQGRILDKQISEFFDAEIAAYFDLEVRDGAQAQTLAINSAEKILGAAVLGMPTAISIVNEGAHLLARTVVSTWLAVEGSAQDAMKLVIQGGPAHNKNYVNKIVEYVTKELPYAILTESGGDNLEGAIWITDNITQDMQPFLRWAAK